VVEDRRSVAIVFARAPVPGEVKTRLIGPLSAVQAATVYRGCLDLALTALQGLAGVRNVAAVTPDDGDFDGVIPGDVRIIPQGAGDLGRRLARAADWAFSRGFDRVVMVGSDCPMLEASDIRLALDALEQHDVVIGPAVDGGYYLIGLSKPAPAVFSGIDWSTERVAPQTVSAAARAGLSVEMLRVLRDLDDVADLRATVAEPDAGLRRDDPWLRFRTGLAALLREIDGP
jgi:hypothetical protein